MAFNKIMRRALALVSVGLLIASGRISNAQQWGTNAPTCPLGRCAPARESWGFYPTKWRRWPGANYPDMTASPAQPGGNQIPPSDIELPNPNKEVEVQTPNPARDFAAPNPATDAGAAEKMGGPGAMSQPGKSPAAPQPNDLMPSPKNAPGALPEEPNMGPPNFGEPAAPSARPGSSSRFQPSTTDAVTANKETNDLKGRRTSWNSSKDEVSMKPATSRINLSGQSDPLSPESEPDLIVPSLSSRPLHTTNVDRSGANPLRDDNRDTVLPAALFETQPQLGITDSAATASPIPSMAPSSGTIRSNPLRRN